MAFSLTRFLKGILISEEGTSTPKSIQLTPGGTANTNTEIVGSQTVNRTLTLPDATDTLVGKNTTDTLTNKTLTSPVINSPTGITKSDVGLGNVDNTSDTTKNSAAVALTNKTIDADLNTISNIENADIKALAAIDASKIANGSVSNTEFQYLANVTSDIQTQLGAAISASGSATLTNKTIDADNNTISNIDNNEIKALAGIDATKIADGTVTNIEFQYIGGLTSDAQTQINSKQDSSTAVTLTGSQTISNKTIDNSNTATLKDSLLTVQDDADVSKQFKFQASGISTATTRTLTVPDADITIVGTAATQTLSNKTLDNTSTITVKDTNFTIQDDADTSKQVKFDASGVTTATTRTLTVPNANTTLVGTDNTQTLTNKTMSGASNTFSNISLSSSVTGTLPIGNGGTNNGSLAVTSGGVLYTDGSKVVNVGAGTSGQILQSNGASAPTWITNSAGGASIAVQFSWTGTQSISHNSMTKLTLSGATQTVLTGFTFSSGTFTCSTAGTYGITLQWEKDRVNDSAVGRHLFVALYKNGAEISRVGMGSSRANNAIEDQDTGVMITRLVTVAVSDTIEAYAYQSNDNGTAYNAVKAYVDMIKY